MANIEFSNYVESLDPASITTGTILIPVSHDGDPESMTPAQIVTAGGGGGGGSVVSVVPTTNRISVDDTDPANPVIDIDAAYDAIVASKEVAANKGASGGYVGMSGFSIAFKNLANTFTSLFQNAATAIRTYTFPDKDLTVVGTVDVIGVQDFFIPASAFWPRVTSGCSSLTQTEIATSLINIQTLDFNQTTQQYAQTHYKFPKKYNLGTLTYEIEWTATTGTGSVVWGVAAVSVADGDALTTAFGSQVNVTDAAGTANTERNSASSAAVTIGNTPGVADGIYLQITRVTGDGSDDMAADAKFKGISIHITTNAATDA
jgi:hypothetical protein